MPGCDVTENQTVPGLDPALGIRDTWTYFAWQAHFGVDLAVERLRALPPDTSNGDGRALVDTTSLVIALWRLRVVAEAETSVTDAHPALVAALGAYDAALPDLRKLRNVTMHFDNYVLENDKRQNRVMPDGPLIGPRDLWAISHSPLGVRWLGVSLTYSQALAAARALYDAIQTVNNGRA